ncbi:MAG: stringent starvation protein B [Alphaproteobacteria bacterium]|uniref:SspB family protein n=1 Tax=Hyphomonas sp. TaxID=87 RepID=UPI001D270803|nr:stringent starvation protein B [Alphaproteobacteria bacterium]MBU2084424.1 stringent starvation protein B [Alphaproteobacteria bacterium]MBU2142432.1 stringent starvation protein B [Alphaproteobacteria bacterium]MBU2196839.1 stringent starvation protein B [Alphaproteobacteria bacterium]
MTDYIGYDALTQAAMRGVVREALKRALANGGLPGEHHFYITFRTKAPGVKVADYLTERFPEDMTIVVQHQFWDLEVNEGHFEIILKFSGVPQHLFVPYAAITRFVDPSVNFGLTFENPTKDDAVIAPAAAFQAAEPEPAPAAGTVVNLDAFRRK